MVRSTIPHMVWIGKQAYRLVNADIDGRRFNAKSSLSLVLDLKHFIHPATKILRKSLPNVLSCLAARSRGQMTKKALRKKQRRKRKKLEAT